MTQQNYKILLEWYAKGQDTQTGKEQIHLTKEELAHRMKFTAKYPPFVGGVYPLKKRHLKIIQSLVNHDINLDENDYFIGSVSLNAKPTYTKYLGTDAWKYLRWAIRDLKKHNEIKLILKEECVIGFILNVLETNEVLSFQKDKEN